MRCLSILTLLIASVANAQDFRVLEDKDAGKAWTDALKEKRIAANDRSTEAWQSIKDRTDWEKFRDARLEELKKGLGQFPEIPKSVRVIVTKKTPGEGFVIENVLIETRPGWFVTANLYRPDKEVASQPGIIIIHSHHNPKTEGELQDMGMTWARQGCSVLVPDMLGHGERRQHPFSKAEAYPKEFKTSRQDYYYRYNSSLQLYLIGDSLMGWMVWDTMRCLDALLQQKGVDPNRTLLLGAVAGGGDPAAVTGALERRFAAVGPFNFGGPQPETRFPLPDDAEKAFNYLGGGSWESTRNLAFSGSGGFLPWVIVGATAPRGLIYGHEFAWDKDRDPVWKRFEKIYGFYKAGDHLAAANGKGSVKGRPPESTHCNNIGAIHREPIHPTLEKWFKIPVPVEYRNRVMSSDLMCWTPELKDKLNPKSLGQAAGEEADRRAVAFRAELARMPADKRSEALAAKWKKLLALEEPGKVQAELKKSQEINGVTYDALVVRSAGPAPIPILVLTPAKTKGKLPVVIALAQEGKEGFLKNRADSIAELLKQGVAVCLPDLRGTGELTVDKGRDRTSGSTSISATSLMLGQPVLGGRLEDVMRVVKALPSPLIDRQRLAFWGDSFAPANPAGKDLGAPLELQQPAQAEPMGGILSLLAALQLPETKAVYARGSLVGYRSVLESPFVHLPHDVIVPGALTAGDLMDVAATLAPRPVRLEALVDGQNRRVEQGQLAKITTPSAVTLKADALDGVGLANWLATQVK